MRYFFHLIMVWALVPFTQLNAYAHQPGDPWIAHYMWRLYYNTTHSCPSAHNEPVYKCTGIILRATNPNKEKDGGWIPELKSYKGIQPHSISAGGVSFSYIRADATFGNLAFKYENGFTLWPEIGKYARKEIEKNDRKDTLKLIVVCAFPIDAATDGRQNRGCGSPLGTSANHCPQGDAHTWMTGFKQYVVNGLIMMNTWAYNYQCGYDLMLEQTSKINFENFLRIKQTTDRLAGSHSTFSTVNELRIRTWALDYTEGSSKAKAEALPIQSFFYIKDTPNGLNNARIDQKKYYDLTGGFIPIVRIKMPTRPHHSNTTYTVSTNLDPNFDFHYQRQDQNPGVAIPFFEMNDPLPCNKGQFDIVCKDGDPAHLSVLH